MKLSILYRGPLGSCNYDCQYCPFAKHVSPKSELLADRDGLVRFVEWVESASDHELYIMITPWGEALVRRWYRDAMKKLSGLPQVRRIAIQTNLSCGLDWIREVDRRAFALWTTFHPGETEYHKFLEKALALHEMGIRFCVGIVGTKAHREVAEQLRRELPRTVYLWVNAYKSEGSNYYDAEDIAAFRRADAWFDLNNVRYASQGRACRAGETSFTVDGTGDVRRCHFVGNVLGNLYRDPLESMLAPRVCPNQTCGCYIGYVNLEHLQLENIYGDGMLERIPKAQQSLAPLNSCARLELR